MCGGGGGGERRRDLPLTLWLKMFLVIFIPGPQPRERVRGGGGGGRRDLPLTLWLKIFLCYFIPGQASPHGQPSPALAVLSPLPALPSYLVQPINTSPDNT